MSAADNNEKAPSRRGSGGAGPSSAGSWSAQLDACLEWLNKFIELAEPFMNKSDQVNEPARVIRSAHTTERQAEIIRARWRALILKGQCAQMKENYKAEKFDKLIRSISEMEEQIRNLIRVLTE